MSDPKRWCATHNKQAPGGGVPHPHGGGVGHGGGGERLAGIRQLVDGYFLVVS